MTVSDMITLAIRSCFNARSLGFVFAAVSPPSSYLFRFFYFAHWVRAKYRDFRVHLEEFDFYEKGRREMRSGVPQRNASFSTPPTIMLECVVEKYMARINDEQSRIKTHRTMYQCERLAGRVQSIPEKRRGDDSVEE